MRLKMTNLRIQAHLLGTDELSLRIEILLSINPSIGVPVCFWREIANNAIPIDDLYRCGLVKHNGMLLTASRRYDKKQHTPEQKVCIFSKKPNF